MTDASGAILNTYDYNAFGDLYAQAGTTINPYLYTSQRYDATTEQYYLRAREYDPVVGRFLSRDTWAVDTWNPVELNRYSYANNSPSKFYDPTGLVSMTESMLIKKSAIPTIKVGEVVGAIALTCAFTFTITSLNYAGIEAKILETVQGVGA